MRSTCDAIIRRVDFHPIRSETERVTIDWLIVATIAGPVIGAFVGGWVVEMFAKRPRLITFYGHVSAFSIKTQAGPFAIYTHDVVVANQGRRTANNVRLGHQVLPENYALNPVVEFDARAIAGGLGAEIVIPKMVPGEAVTVTYVYFPPLTYDKVNTYVKSDEGAAKRIEVITQKRFSKWVTIPMLVLTLIGVITVLYLFALWVIHLAGRAATTN